MTRSSVQYADIARLALQRRRLFLTVPLLLATIFVCVSLVLPRAWTTSASFTPQQSGGSLSSLSGLASQFGVSVPVGGDGQGPDFYSEVLRGDNLLRGLLRARFTLVGGAPPVLLAAHLRPSVADSARREALALRDLRQLISTSVGLKSGIVRFSVTANDPLLAKGIADRALALVNQFNVEAQKNQAAGEFAFSAERLELARGELRRAEDELASFLAGNRESRQSPTLSLREERFRREVGIRQQVMVALTQSLEQARIEQARGTPVITIVESPVVPGIPDSRLLLFKALAVAFTSTVALMVLLLAKAARLRLRDQQDDAGEELELLWQDTVQDLRRPWRLLSSGTDRRRAAQRRAS